MSTYEVRGINLGSDINTKFDPETAAFLVEGDVMTRTHQSGELAIPMVDAERLEVERRHDSGLYRLIDRLRGAWQNRVGEIRDFQVSQVHLDVVVPSYTVPPVVGVTASYTTKPAVADVHCDAAILSQDQKDARLLEVMARMGHDDVFAGFMGLDEVPSFKDKGVDFFLAGVDVDKVCSMAPYIPRRVDLMVLAIVRSAPASWNLPGDTPENDRW